VVGECSEKGGMVVRDVKLTIAVSLALTVAVGALTLTRSPPRLVGARAVETAELASTVDKAAACQANEVLPRGVTAIRLTLETLFGSGVLVRAYSTSRLLTEGRRAAGWAGGSVTVPVVPLNHTVSHVKICFQLLGNSEPVGVVGVRTPPREAAVSRAGQRLSGRFGVEYLAAGRGSWWSRALSVARHIGIGHAFSGTWVALLIAALMAAVGALALRVAWRELP
jgi:hypothetical protein